MRHAVERHFADRSATALGAAYRRWRGISRLCADLSNDVPYTARSGRIEISISLIGLNLGPIAQRPQRRFVTPRRLGRCTSASLSRTGPISPRMTHDGKPCLLHGANRAYRTADGLEYRRSAQLAQTAICEPWQRSPTVSLLAVNIPVLRNGRKRWITSRGCPAASP